MFAPLEPSGSRRPSSGPSPDRPSRRSTGVGRRCRTQYVIVLARRARCRRRRRRCWSQTSNVCVVALPKFFTPCPVDDDPRAGRRPCSVPIRIAPAPGGRVEVGPERREHVVRPCRVREVLRREHDVAAVAAAEHEVAVRDDADPRVRLAAVVERRHVEVRDRVVADAGDRRDAEERQRQVAAGRARRSGVIEVTCGGTAGDSVPLHWTPSPLPIDGAGRRDVLVLQRLALLQRCDRQARVASPSSRGSRRSRCSARATSDRPVGRRDARRRARVRQRDGALLLHERDRDEDRVARRCAASSVIRPEYWPLAHGRRVDRDRERDRSRPSRSAGSAGSSASCCCRRRCRPRRAGRRDVQVLLLAGDVDRRPLGRDRRRASSLRRCSRCSGRSGAADRCRRRRSRRTSR